MTKEEFNEFYKKNKIAVIGVPFLICFILFNQFVIKPARLAKQPGAQPGIAAPAGPTGAVPAPGEIPPLSDPPPPVSNDLSMIPKLDKRVESRLLAAGAYPYGASKNIFIKEKIEERPMVAEAPVEEITAPEVIERPDITYHGFFKVGTEKVAILKISDRLTLSRVGQALLETPFVLQSVQPDRIIITDTAGENRQFEVILSDTQPPTTMAGVLTPPSPAPRK